MPTLPFIFFKIFETALLWTAPENINFPYPKKTKEGDIYALGIIIAEIINRTRPFASYTQYTSRGI